MVSSWGVNNSTMWLNICLSKMKVNRLVEYFSKRMKGKGSGRVWLGPKWPCVS